LAEIRQGLVDFSKLADLSQFFLNCKTKDKRQKTKKGRRIKEKVKTLQKNGGQAGKQVNLQERLKYRKAEIEITSVQSTTQATGTVQDKLETHLQPNAFRTTEGNADIEVTFVNHGMKVNDSIVVSHAGTVGGISSNQINGTSTT